MLTVTAPVDCCFGTEAAYDAALESWAADTMSNPDPSWKGPGVYRYGGYQDDDGRPMATLEKILPC